MEVRQPGVIWSVRPLWQIVTIHANGEAQPLALSRRLLESKSARARRRRSIKPGGLCPTKKRTSTNRFMQGRTNQILL